MGQSNMQGYGEILPEDTIPVPNVFKIPTLGSKKYEWQPAAQPLHNRSAIERFGLGLPFAIAYQEKHPNVRIELIPVAWGGSQIDSLDKGTNVYDDAINKALFAQKTGIIKGVLWHQGESDTVTKELANSYEGKLHKLIYDIRADLDLPNLPFIVGNLAEFYGTGSDHDASDRVQQIKTVMTALRNLPSKVKNSGFVESTDCTSADHHMVHFDRESYIVLGKRYAREYEEVISKH